LTQLVEHIQWTYLHVENGKINHVVNEVMTHHGRFVELIASRFPEPYILTRHLNSLHPKPETRNPEPKGQLAGLDQKMTQLLEHKERYKGAGLR